LKLREGHVRLQAAQAVRQAAGVLPAHPGPAREDARRGHGHAALLHADRAPGESSRLSDTIAGLAKLNNTRKARWVIAEARDLLGGNGILLENHVIRHMGDIEVIHTFEAPRRCRR
jgi:alkylation response protein AidB-like acyl-CoA dehydrogenase